MPYITKDARLRLDSGEKPLNDGELCYLLYKEMLTIYKAQEESFTAARFAMQKAQIFTSLPVGMSEETVATVTKMAKLEFYRRIIAPYEDKKREENGDVEA